MPVVPADDEEWTIGVSDVPPWELAQALERPAAMPSEQPAPWQASQRERAPWEEPVLADQPAPDDSPMPARFTPTVDVGAPEQPSAPWDQPVRPQPAPWDRRNPAELAPTRDDVPWDRPAPFTLDDPLSDPYDAFAPLADDFALATPVPAAASAADPARDSVFGNAIGASSRSEPVAASALAVEDAVPHANAEEAPMFEATSAAEEPAVEAPALNPLEWPPVPTDFPAKTNKPATRARKQPPADPLEWPPIPADLFRRASAESGGLWDASASSAGAIVPDAAPPSPSGQSMAMLPDVAPPPSPMTAATAIALEQAASDLEAPADDPALEDDWTLRNVVDDRAARVPVPSARPRVQPDDPDADSGAVFARYAASVAAPSRPQMLPPRRVDDPFDAGSASERGDDLWFLANEPQPVDGAADVAETEPSSMQTAVATVLVAAIVIGLVIVFLLLFTTVFS